MGRYVKLSDLIYALRMFESNRDKRIKMVMELRRWYNNNKKKYAGKDAYYIVNRFLTYYDRGDVK